MNRARNESLVKQGLAVRCDSFFPVCGEYDGIEDIEQIVNGRLERIPYPTQLNKPNLVVWLDECGAYSTTSKQQSFDTCDLAQFDFACRQLLGDTAFSSRPFSGHWNRHCSDSSNTVMTLASASSIRSLISRTTSPFCSKITSFFAAFLRYS